MSFQFVPDPQVSLAVNSLSNAIRDFYLAHVVPALKHDPFPSPGDPLIHQLTARDGGLYYHYYDGIVPYVFRYFVDGLPGGTSGLIYMARAMPPNAVILL